MSVATSSGKCFNLSDMLRSYLLPAVLAFACSATAPGAFAQAMPNMPGMEHSHHHEATPEDLEKLGTVHFPVSCTEKVRAPFERGIALLHSFGYVETEKQFREIAAQDPTCAMAHWGIAMTQYQELWGRPSPEMVKAGTEEMAKAEALAKSAAITPREHAYIDALNGFFLADAKDFQTAADGYVTSMKALHEAYPDDTEGSAFYALALIASVAPDDTSLRKETAALAVLTPLFAAHPDHPGLAHYIIHTCDTPKLAPQGLEAAKVYAKIAPSSAHALHMPGHIFARLGMWQDDIASNEASVAASYKAEADHEPGAAHQMHAKQFLIYAYLQTGQDQKARELTQQMRSVSERMAAMPGMDDMKNSGHFFDNQLSAIYPMEMHDWKTLSTIKPAPGSKDDETFDSYWGQGVAAGHLKNVKLATAALTEYSKAIDALKKGPYAYAAESAQVEYNEIAGWKAFAEGDSVAAVTSMRKAADQQDKLGQGEVDIPAREMLGDLLMLEGKPSDALKEYKVALTLSPNRLNGLLSAGAAEEALGDKTAAARYYTKAAQNTNDAATSRRPELRHAVEFVKQQASATKAE